MSHFRTIGLLILRNNDKLYFSSSEEAYFQAITLHIPWILPNRFLLLLWLPLHSHHWHSACLPNIKIYSLSLPHHATSWSNPLSLSLFSTSWTNKAHCHPKSNSLYLRTSAMDLVSTFLPNIELAITRATFYDLENQKIWVFFEIYDNIRLILRASNLS